MNFNFAFVHMESSEAVKQIAEEKFSSVFSKYLHNQAVNVKVTFEVVKDQHQLTVHMHAGSEFHVDLKEKSEDMYKTINMMADKIESQLSRQLERVHKSDRTDRKRIMGKLASDEEAYQDEVNSIDASELTH